MINCLIVGAGQYLPKQSGNFYLFLLIDTKHTP